MAAPKKPAGGFASMAEVYESVFFAQDCVDSVKQLHAALTKEKPIAPAHFKKILEWVLGTLATGDLPEDAKGLRTADKENTAIYLGLYDLLACAIRLKVKDATVTADLAKLQFPAVYSAEILKTFTSGRDTLEKLLQTQRITLPTVTGVNWRIDITISTTTLSRVFKPSVTVQLTLSDGRIRTFECSVKKFQELRYNVAKVLKEMLDLQQHPTLTRDV